MPAIFRAKSPGSAAIIRPISIITKMVSTPKPVGVSDSAERHEHRADTERHEQQRQGQNRQHNRNPRPELHDPFPGAIRNLERRLFHQVEIEKADQVLRWLGGGRYVHGANPSTVTPRRPGEHGILMQWARGVSCIPRIGKVCPGCGWPAKDCKCSGKRGVDQSVPGRIVAKLRMEKKGRGGKIVDRRL